MKTKNLLILFIVGALLGPVCDGFHTHSWTLRYPHPWLFEMEGWVPLLFGLAAVIIGYSHLYLDQFLKRRPERLDWGTVIIGLVCFVMIYFGSAFMKVGPYTLIASLFVGSIIVWNFFDRTWQGALLALGTATAGCAVEITLIHFKLFYYVFPDIFGIPYWLPTLYIVASVTVGNLARKLEE